jgi:hypothetical protein
LLFGLFFVLVVFMDFGSPLSVAERIALSLDALAGKVAARIAFGVMKAAMIVLVWQRIKRVDREIRRLLARFQAGRLRVAGTARGRGAGRARVAREGKVDAGQVDVGQAGAGQAGAGQAGAERLPRRFGWLLPLVPADAACFGGQIAAALAEPEMVALLEASPQARRVLRPLCRMLAVEMRPEAPRAKRPAAEVVREKPVGVARAGAQPEVEAYRIPLPRGVLAAARRQGYGRR